jgi:hypothetical protein
MPLQIRIKVRARTVDRINYKPAVEKTMERATPINPEDKVLAGTILEAGKGQSPGKDPSPGKDRPPGKPRDVYPPEPNDVYPPEPNDVYPPEPNDVYPPEPNKPRKAHRGNH